MKQFLSILFFVGMIFLSGTLSALPPYENSGAVRLEPIMGTVSKISGTNTVDNTSYIDANSILMFVTNHGNFGRDLNNVFDYDYGTFYPYIDTASISMGINYASPLYAGGIWLGGIDSATGQVLVTISEYSCEYVPGPMEGGTYQPDNPDFKVYKLFLDSLQGNPNSDYLNWPSDQGAPLDGYGNPLCLEDQTLWTVYNDADPNQHSNNSGCTAPLGVEVQQMVWASNMTDDDTIYIPTEFDVTQLGTSNLAVRAIAVDNNAIAGNEYLVELLWDAVKGPYWQLRNVTTGELLLLNQITFNGDRSSIVQGLQVMVSLVGENAYGNWEYTSATPENLSPVAVDEQGYEGGLWFTGGEHGGDIFFGGVWLEPNFWGGTTINYRDYKPIEIRFRPMVSYTDLNSNGVYSIGEPYIVDNPAYTQKAFMYQTFSGAAYSGFYDVPFTVWDMKDPDNPRQLNVVVRDRDQNYQWDLHNLTDPPDDDLPYQGDQQYNYVWILNTDYDPSGTYYGDGTDGTIDFFGGDDGLSVYDAMWVLWLDDRGMGGMLAEEGTFKLTPGLIYSAAITDSFTFVSEPPQTIVSGNDDVSIFIKYILRNKGSRNIKDMYFSLWADPDLGGSGDDLVGCDTLDNIFYCYNSWDYDSYYFNKPPASGFKLIYGPQIPSPGDSANYEGRYIQDYKNLNMTSFCKYINGSDPDTYLESYYYMQGLTKDGSPYIYDGHQLKYWNSGDPIAVTGDLDMCPADRRMMASSGPFDFRPGDSQFVLIKFGVGQGNNRLASITKLKEILNAPFDMPVDVEEETPFVLPGQYAISQNYPNPFNSRTVIEYALPERSHVAITIYNILGQKVTTLIDKEQPPGNYRVVWDGRDTGGEEVASGIYFYSIRSEKYHEARKMLLIK
ncbi:MAG: FlgD immunoglobulin-like domain containing protein [Candidatus Zixiibacteriota bacterium]